MKTRIIVEIEHSEFSSEDIRQAIDDLIKAETNDHYYVDCGDVGSAFDYISRAEVTLPG